jgi:hypothetical protein
MAEVRYHRNVLLFLDELIDVLIENGYFSFYEYSARYIEDLVLYVKENISTRPHRQAPPYFSKYGDNLVYITYQKNKRTTWYIFFQKINGLYFIRYITNNHFEGQYFK